MKENPYEEAGREAREEAGREAREEAGRETRTGPDRFSNRARRNVPARVLTLALFPLVALNLALTLSLMFGVVGQTPVYRGGNTVADSSEGTDSEGTDSEGTDSEGTDSPGGTDSRVEAGMPDGEKDARQLYEDCAEAVVYLRTLDADGAFVTAGSAFVVTPEGLAMTAAHVVKKGERIHAVLPSGEEIGEIELLERDDTLDTAVLRLPERADGYACLPLAESLPESGEGAWAIGYPLRTVKLIVDGIVASPKADINGTARMLITTDLASGMSGGPILRADGTVIGIASATLRTMNGVNISPTAEQIAQAVAPYLEPQTEPAEGNAEPAEGNAEPAEENAEPAEENAEPAEENAEPVEEMEKEAGQTGLPQEGTD